MQECKSQPLDIRSPLDRRNHHNCLRIKVQSKYQSDENNNVIMMYIQLITT